MDTPSVRIRGIYATALTALALERGLAVTDPSLRIQERLRLSPIERARWTRVV